MERFAVLIGIDDQDSDGLHFCTKDVDDLSVILEKHCMFKKKNIFKITSKYQNENRSALTELDNIIETLKVGALTSNDLLLLYFSGHGKFNIDTEQSYLKFPSGDLPTLTIKSYIDVLHPKHSIIIFDACFSGAKILSKNFSIQKLKRKLHIDSEGVFGIYGAPTEREAYLPPKLENSLLTYHLIKAIEDPNNYDDENSTSIDSLASIAAKNVYKHSVDLVKKGHINKEQIIVREGRIEGWLPFSEIANKAQKLTKDEKPALNPSSAKAEEPIKSIEIDEEEVFEALLNEVKRKLKLFNAVIAAKILCYYSDKPYVPSFDVYKNELNEAIRKGIMDEDGEIRSDNRQVAELIKAITKFNTFISDSKRTPKFDEFFEDEFHVSPYDGNTQDFWEGVYGLSVPKEY